MRDKGAAHRAEGIKTTEIAIIYESSLGGHVAKTAEFMAKQLDADIFDLKKQTNIDMSEYSRIILGTGIHAGRPYGRVVSFAKANKKVLDTKKTSLFICCIYRGDRGDEQCEKVSKSIGIADAAYFPDKGETDADGNKKEVVSFVQRMRA